MTDEYEDCAHSLLTPLPRPPPDPELEVAPQGFVSR
jgi:hypothetical protein